MSTIKIENIKKATYNGRQVKIFDARDNKGLFMGQFSAPVKTANKNLVDFVK